MKNIIESLSLFSSAKIIHNAMDSHVNVDFIDEEISHEFDKNKKYFLYIHIPFCENLCSFCTFHKFKYDENTCKEYFKSLREELINIKEKGFDFNTLYLGGGTPLIDAKELYKTIELAKKLFNIKEVSCETSPNHIKPEILKTFDGLIDRLSIGVQSFDDEILKDISRYKKYGSSKVLQEKINDIKGIIPTISLDLIFNFPTQNQEMLIKDLQIAKALDVEQITTYPLMSEKLKNSSTFEHLKIVQKSNEFKFYNIIREELKDFKLNNAWAFSKKDTNLTDEYIIDNTEYIGAGSGAFTHLNDRLYVNAYDLKQYSNLVKNHKSTIVAKTKKFELKKQIQYQFLNHLFEGSIDIKKFNELFKVSLESILKKELTILKLLKAIVISENKIYPTRLGEYITVVMMREFYMGMDRIRAKLKRSIIS